MPNTFSIRARTRRTERRAQFVGIGAEGWKWIEAEGWKWTEAALGFAYGHTTGLRRLYGERPAVSDEEQAAHEALTDELECLYAAREGDEDLPRRPTRVSRNLRCSPTRRSPTIRPVSRPSYASFPR